MNGNNRVLQHPFAGLLLLFAAVLIITTTIVLFFGIEITIPTSIGLGSSIGILINTFGVGFSAFLSYLLILVYRDISREETNQSDMMEKQTELINRQTRTIENQERLMRANINPIVEVVEKEVQSHPRTDEVKVRLSNIGTGKMVNSKLVCDIYVKREPEDRLKRVDDYFSIDKHDFELSREERPLLSEDTGKEMRHKMSGGVLNPSDMGWFESDVQFERLKSANGTSTRYDQFQDVMEKLYQAAIEEVVFHVFVTYRGMTDEIALDTGDGEHEENISSKDVYCVKLARVESGLNLERAVNTGEDFDVAELPDRRGRDS